MALQKTINFPDGRVAEYHAIRRVMENADGKSGVVRIFFYRDAAARWKGELPMHWMDVAVVWTSSIDRVGEAYQYIRNAQGLLQGAISV